MIDCMDNALSSKLKQLHKENIDKNNYVRIRLDTKTSSCFGNLVIDDYLIDSDYIKLSAVTFNDYIGPLDETIILKSTIINFSYRIDERKK